MRTDVRQESEIAQYLIAHIDEDLTCKKVAKVFGYRESYFKRLFTDIFDIPFARYLKMIRMRDAAREMISAANVSISEMALKYGYSSLYQFSRAFKQEIGLSPRGFIHSGRAVPDMPLKKQIRGHNVYLSYASTDDIDIRCRKIPAPYGINTDILENCAYALEFSEYDHPDESDGEEIGFWWSESADELFYMVGHRDFLTDRSKETDADSIVQIPGAYYSVFSVDVSADPAEMLRTQRELAWYVMKEWRVVNRKKADRMSYTYEVFCAKYSYLYLPLNVDIVEEKPNNSNGGGIDSWIQYIDDHIKEDVSVSEIAAHFHYSEAHFRKIFNLYYEISPLKYIRKRRLYLAAEELSKTSDPARRKKIATKFFFKTTDAFTSLFFSEFGMDPEEYGRISTGTIDLNDYYSKNRDKVRISTREIREFTAVGFSKEFNAESEEADIPGVASYWLTHDNADLREMLRPGSDDPDIIKIALWGFSDIKEEYEYLIGYAVREDVDIADEYTCVTVRSGKYVVFESENENDLKATTDIYRMLTRISFYGWVRENRYRVDFNRLTFVSFYNYKLYFYIPVYE